MSIQAMKWILLVLSPALTLWGPVPVSFAVADYLSPVTFRGWRHFTCTKSQQRLNLHPRQGPGPNNCVGESKLDKL